MSTRYSDLAAALTEALQDQLSSSNPALVIERRLNPRLDRTEFDPTKVYLGIYVGSAGWELIARQADKQEWQILLAIQAAVPRPSAHESGNPFGAVTSSAADPVSWADSVFEIVERVKDLWRAEKEDGSQSAGALREQILAGCDSTALLHDPVYVADHLTELGILTSVVALTFQVVED